MAILVLDFMICYGFFKILGDFFQTLKNFLLCRNTFAKVEKNRLCDVFFCVCIVFLLENLIRSSVTVRLPPKTAQTTKSMKRNNIPLKRPIKLQQEMQKKIWNFPKFVRFLGHFLKKQCFWKMGMAGIKQGPCPSTIPSF